MALELHAQQGFSGFPLAALAEMGKHNCPENLTLDQCLNCCLLKRDGSHACIHYSIVARHDDL
jgi:hypothetical protein